MHAYIPYIYTHIYACMNAYICTHLDACMYMKCMHTSTHTYIHIHTCTLTH
jgi:hypothetical protein